MKALVVYDSYFGNTENVAVSIGDALKELVEVEVKKVSDLEIDQLAEVDFLIVGSPTRAFQATKNIKEFLKHIKKEDYAQLKVIAFDTRIAPEDTDSKVLNRMVKAFGYAAEPMGTMMQKRGAKLLLDPIGFYVKDTEGPLKEGEKDRAVNWVKEAIIREIKHE